MNSSNAVVLLVAFGYLGLSLIVGIVPGKRASETTDGFVSGDRSLGLLLMYFITGATIFSAFAFLGAPGWAYSRGASVIYILAYGALGFVPFYFVGPRAARVGRKLDIVTQAEMVARRFDLPSLSLVMAVLSVIAFIPYLAIQIKGAGYILSAMSSNAIPEEVGGAIVYLVVLAYVLKSGVLGVGWTNTLQGVFMMVLAWGLGLYLPTRLYGGVQEMFVKIAELRPELLTAPGLSSKGGPWSWGEYSTAILASIIGFSMWPHLFMKAFTAKDERTIRRTVVLYPTFQIFLIPLFLIGFSGVFFQPPPEAPDQILPHMLMHLEIPSVVVGLFCAGGLAASMSSGDAMVHAAASIAVRDGWAFAFKKQIEPARERSIIRVAVVVVLVASYLLAVLYKKSLVTLLLYAYGAPMQFAPGVVLSLFKEKVRGRAVLYGLIAGGITTLAFTIYPEWRPFPIHAGVLGLILNLAVVFFGSLGAPVEGLRFLEIARGRSVELSDERG